MRLESLAVHAGTHPDPTTGAIAPPLHLSTTFQHGPAGERVSDFEYAREGNPNVSQLEAALAALEHGAAALTFASGMAATDALLSALPDDSHVLIPHDVYHGVRVLGREFLARQGVTLEAVDVTDAAAVARAIKPNTRCIWIETQSNPQLQIADIAAIAQLARRAGALLAVDSTFATPCLQQPLTLGADVVMHSTTKYLGGHSDVVGGALVVGENTALRDQLTFLQNAIGSVAGPFDSFLALRGVKTLAFRPERKRRITSRSSSPVIGSMIGR